MTDTLWLTAALAGLVIVATWLARRAHRRLLATVSLVTLPVTSSHLGNQREVVILLPPGYAASRDRAYRVLYIHDGQDREALRLHETLARLQARRAIAPVIVVAVPTNDERLREYGTAVAPNAQGLGNRAGDYALFITEELQPLIEERFRICGRAIILGASLGGLSAFDVAWNHPGHFAAVGVMSGSFWWRAADDETAVTPGRRIAHEMVRGAAEIPDLQFWFQAGTRDETSDRDGNGVIDAIQDTMELMDELAARGYVAGRDMVYVVVAGGRHNYATWAAVLPEFLQWALVPGRRC